MTKAELQKRVYWLERECEGWRRALVEHWELREKFNAAIMSFDPGYAGWNYLESAMDVIRRCRIAEDALRDAVRKELEGKE